MCGSIKVVLSIRLCVGIVTITYYYLLLHVGGGGFLVRSDCMGMVWAWYGMGMVKQDGWDGMGWYGMV